MRLIDADKIDFKEIFRGKSDFAKDLRKAAQDFINAQPTAYDINKVIKQLEQESQNIELIYPTDQGYDYEDAVGIDINKAKEIVKSGAAGQYAEKPPCAVGDAVYVKMPSGGYTGKVTAFTNSPACGLCIVVTSQHINRQVIPLSKFGKTVFLTKP